VGATENTETGKFRTEKMTDQIAGLEKAQMQHANDLMLHLPALKFCPSFTGTTNSEHLQVEPVLKCRITRTSS